MHNFLCNLCKTLPMPARKTTGSAWFSADP